MGSFEAEGNEGFGVSVSVSLSRGPIRNLTTLTTRTGYLYTGCASRTITSLPSHLTPPASLSLSRLRFAALSAMKFGDEILFRRTNRVASSTTDPRPRRSSNSRSRLIRLTKVSRERHN